MAIGRREILLAGAAFSAGSAAAALPVPPGDALRFLLIRHDSEIGTHTLAFERHDGLLTVRINVEARVSLLSVPIVHYTHRVVETWQDGVLTAVTGDTDKNGRNEWVRAHRTTEGLRVEGSKTQPYVAPDSAIGTSYWNKHMLDGPMISMEDGVLLRPRVTRLAPQSITAASGAPIMASHFNLSGSFNVDVWYDEADAWAGLSFTAADGSDIRYARV